jgi:hypothetical protein
MGIEETNYSAIDILNMVDGAELVTMVREVYLCVWHGGNVVEIHDIRDASIDPDHQVLPMWSDRTLLTVHDAIDDYFMQFDADNEQNDLTTAPVRVIVES